MVTSSVKYEELKELREKFPSEFIDNYTWLVPIDLIEQTTMVELTGQPPKQITQNPYPVEEYRGCSCGYNPISGEFACACR